MEDFKEQFERRKCEAEEIIYSYLPEEKGYQKTVIEAMNYSVKAGGKRLRPILIRETARLFGYMGRDDEPFMAAIEMIHTYSLVHDDLPAMDNDSLRRGKPTTHIKYGHAMGVLAGDALLNYAFETAMDGIRKSKIPDRSIRALQILAKKSGIYGMVGGQTVDVELTGKSIDEKTLDFIYRLKTGALLEASMVIGAVLSGTTNDNIEKIKQVALCVGMAFQIQDDILDVESTTEELGKPVLSDEKNEKATFVSLFGKEKAKEKVEEYTNKAIEILDSLDYSNIFLKNLLLQLVGRKK